MMFLIQGAFFQNEEERKSLVQKDLYKSTYHGMIFTDPNNESQLTGKIFDYLGIARLFDISVSEQELLFTKQYGSSNGFATLKYQFKRQDNFYVGECVQLFSDGTTNEKRVTRCVLTQVPDDFFIEPQ